MNLLPENPWGLAFAGLGRQLPRPRLVLVISAHWFGPGVYLSAHPKPSTLHDFGGFPAALYQIRYPAPGDPAAADVIAAKLARWQAKTDPERGLDHGCWSVLHWLLPDADIPVLQLSIDHTLAAEEHFEIGKCLAPLRDEGVLILASGNIVHNLPHAFGQMRAGTSETPDWAQRFDAQVKDRLLSGERHSLLELYPGTADAALAHPTPDHWLPLLYAAGASTAHEPVHFPIEGFDLGSISMRSVVFGG